MVKPVVILGNGPSLRDFDFKRLDKIDTIGLNAAYRFWEKINWYPTYYCCYDHQLILTHHAQIADLILTGKVKKAFIRDTFFEHQPDLKNDDRFVTLEKIISTKFFQSQERRMMITTGSHATRTAMYLGYKKILLLGIDLKYVEIIDEAEPVSRIVLKINKTPEKNPNYFFDDYQREGDYFNIPNPCKNLHEHVFVTLQKDMIMYNYDVEVINCNMNSILYDKQILPYNDLDAELAAASYQKIDAIFVIITNEYQNFIQLIDKMQISNTVDPCKLYFVMGPIKNNETEEKINEMFTKTEYLQETFTKINFYYPKINDEQNCKQIYGDNYLFNYAVINILTNFSRFDYSLILSEKVCFCKDFWFDILNENVKKSEPFYIKGSVYRGNMKLSNDIKYHININAIYSTGNTDFINIINKFIEWLQKTPLKNKTFLIDIALHSYFNALPNSTINSFYHKLTYTNLIQNRYPKITSSEYQQLINSNDTVLIIVARLVKNNVVK